ncbi:hypothetical protein F1188_10570 [Roseospira marina]|uniref:Molybdate ABC transporter substrate-binding protein n=1 Tax=Roseospira marina TaxID=140057 RepID=A0A5M6ID50_9PROT|nr:substrate-binding domain-containing protein [Roseospira marina]KAA5605665.1 hypothetical protein F1188_10570 [Roseospira marina]MBB4313257.1 molybdate transport system substrate-binding protein [Roseospira marina]MBB5086002.1 molybdate transport system substrate-binding protein [Roseospira marina]
MATPAFVSRRAALTGAAAATALALAPSSGRAQTAGTTVFADPSLKPVLQSLLPTVQKTAGLSLMVAFGEASGAAGRTGSLVHDVIIVAGAGNMARLVDAGQVEPPTDLLTNGLALVAAPGRAAPDAVRRGMDLTAWVDRDAPLALVDPAANSIGETSLDALRALGWGEGVSRRVVLAPGPSTVLDWVAHDEAALGVALANAARHDTRVRVVGAFPPGTSTPVLYQVAVRAGTPVDAPARRFVHALYSEAAHEAFRADGLVPLVAR